MEPGSALADLLVYGCNELASKRLAEKPKALASARAARVRDANIVVLPWPHFAGKNAPFAKSDQGSSASFSRPRSAARALGYFRIARHEGGGDKPADAKFATRASAG